MAPADVPLGVDRVRHLELRERGRQVWWRRAGILVIAAVPVLGLLNFFGQHAVPVGYSSTAASLTIDSPSRVRGGLMFTTEIVITPHRPLADARLYLDNGWFKAMTLNGVAPQPSTETAENQWQIWDLGSLAEGSASHLWISWQTNPTNVGRHPQNLALYDGSTRLMTVDRTLTAFP